MTGKKGLLIILSSPSGGGKTSVYMELLRMNKEFLYSVSATTRPKRKGEIDGESYFFLGEDDFLKQVKENKFAEYARVYDNYYGTYRSTVEDAINSGKVILMDVDTQGALNLQNEYKEAVTIFLVPPSLEILEQRLAKRGTDNLEVRNRRLEETLKEIAEVPNYKYVVINDLFDQTVSSVESIIEAESLKTSSYSDDYFLKMFSP